MSTVKGCQLVQWGVLGLFIALGTMSGCKEDVGVQPPPGGRVQAIFDPGALILPTPTDLAKNPETGLLQVPVADESTSPAQAAFDKYLNTLDGFPTSAEPTFCLSGAVNHDTLADAIKVVMLPQTSDELPTDLTAEITMGDPVATLACPVLSDRRCDPTADTSGCADGERCVGISSDAAFIGRCATPGFQVELRRSKAWERGRTFGLYVTSALKQAGEGGASVIRSPIFELVAAPSPLCAWDAEQQACTFNYSALITSSVSGTLEEINEAVAGTDQELSPIELEAKVRQVELKTATDLERVRQSVQALVQASGLTRDDVVLAWGFSVVGMVEAAFDPAAAKPLIPGPGNDLIYDLVNKKVNIPERAGETAQEKALRLALNTLDGFSTTASYYTTFLGGKLKGASVQAGDELLVLNLSDLGAQSPPVTFAYEDGADAITMTPTEPLAEGTQYAVLLLSRGKTSTVTGSDGAEQQTLTSESGGGLADSAGRRIVPSPVFALAKSPAPLVDGDGKSQVSVLDDASAAALEPLRVAYNLVLGVAQLARQVKRDDVVVLWTFTTQTFTPQLAALRALPYAALAGAESGAGKAGPEFLGFHLVNVPDCADPPVQPCWPAGVPRDAIDGWTASGRFQSWNALDPATGAFLADPATGKPTQRPNSSAPVRPEDEDVPFFLTTPKGLACTDGACPDGFDCIGTAPDDHCVPAAEGPGWPVVIFQHGITGSKVQFFAIANTLAQAGYATLAFDAPFHGDRSACNDDAQCQTGRDSPPTDTVCEPTKRRCCAADDANDCKTAYFVDADADSVPDASGGPVFVNTQNPFALRDNIRQYAIDASALLRAIALGAASSLLEVDAGNLLPTDRPVTLDPTRVSFIGHSMGAIFGVLALATNGLSVGDGPQRAVLNVPGAPVVRIFQDSEHPSFVALVDQALAAQGVTRGSAGELEFFHVLQWVLDPADPANFARYVQTEQLPDLVAGEGALVPAKEVLFQTASEDSVIPPARQTALASWIGADVSKSTYAADHGFLLLPDPNEPGLIQAAQSQAVQFLLTGQVCEPTPSTGQCQ